MSDSHFVTSGIWLKYKPSLKHKQAVNASLIQEDPSYFNLKPKWPDLSNWPNDRWLDSSLGWSIIPMHPVAGSIPQLGYMQEEDNEGINNRNKLLFLSLSPSLPLKINN